MRWNLFGTAAASALFGLIAATSGANAALVVDTGNNPPLGSLVIDNNSCDAGIVDAGPAMTISACVQNDHGQQVDFTSDELITYAAGGQAQIVSDDGNGFSYLKIEVVGQLISKLILNIDAIADGFVTFSDGVDTSAPQALAGNGNNFFTITGGPFSFIEFTATSAVAAIAIGDNVDDVKQVRLTYGPRQQISEPALLGLLGLGLIGIAAARRRA